MLCPLGHSAPVVNTKPVRSSDYSLEIQRSGPAILPAMYHSLHCIALVLRRGAGHRAGRRRYLPLGVHCLYVHLHPGCSDGSAAGGGPGEVTLRTLPRLRDHVLSDIAFELHHLVRRGPIADSRATHDLVIALAHHVAVTYPWPGGPEPRLGTRFLEQVMDLFPEGPASSCRVGRVAEWCGLSRSHFSHRFRALTGLWPQAMVLGSRIEAAKHLLEQGSLSLGEVAYASGFADQSHLTRAFRQAPVSRRPGTGTSGRPRRPDSNRTDVQDRRAPAR